MPQARGGRPGAGRGGRGVGAVAVAITAGVGSARSFSRVAHNGLGAEREGREGQGVGGRWRAGE